MTLGCICVCSFHEDIQSSEEPDVVAHIHSSLRVGCDQRAGGGLAVEAYARADGRITFIAGRTEHSGRHAEQRTEPAI